jgi:membrane-associated phospholipid phosphatase
MHLARGAGHGSLEPVASTLNWIGDPGTVVAPVVLTAAGWLGHQPDLTTMGMRAMESVALSGGVTALIKGTAGRSRPSPASLDADDFAFSGGFKRGATSFPSGHTTAAFALATSLTAETHRLHPHATWLVGATSYSIATGVGFARVYTDHHWASDVALGAGIGTLSALFVDRVVHSGLPRHGLLAWLH